MEVKQACIDFLAPTVKEYAENNNIAGLLKLIEARKAFGNEYFGRIPGLLVITVLEVLEQDVTLIEYLEGVVVKKLRMLAGLPTSKKAMAGKKAEGVNEVDEMLLFEERKEPVGA